MFIIIRVKKCHCTFVTICCCVIRRNKRGMWWNGWYILQTLFKYRFTSSYICFLCSATQRNQKRTYKFPEKCKDKIFSPCLQSCLRRMLSDLWFKLIFIGTTQFINLFSAFVKFESWHSTDTAMWWNIWCFIHINLVANDIWVFCCNSFKNWSDVTASDVLRGKVGERSGYEYVISFLVY